MTGHAGQPAGSAAAYWLGGPIPGFDGSVEKVVTGLANLKRVWDAAHQIVVCCRILTAIGNPADLGSGLAAQRFR